MNNFQLQIAEQSFEDRGVRAEFDRERYAELMHSLVDEVPETRPPSVLVSPAEIWGMSKPQQVLSHMARLREDFPQARYSAKTGMLIVDAAEDVKETNSDLIYATRRWAAFQTGEMKELRAYLHDRRFSRKANFLLPIALGGVAGASIGGGDETFAGAAIGATIGLVSSIIDAQRNPYYKAWREYAKDPDVLARFGNIVTYHAL